MAENERLNPQITEVEVGKRTLRNITVYPMSLADEKLFGDVVQGALQKYFDQKVSDDEAELVGFVDFLIKLIEKNLIKILGLITDDAKPKKLLEEMTNFQLSDLVMTIYEVNFEQPSKNAKSLLDKMKNLLLLSRGLSQQSLSDIPNTDSIISTPESSETGD